MLVHLDDNEVGQWTVATSTYREYRTILPVTAGIHTVELSMASDPGADVDLVVDFADVYFAVAGGDYDGDGVVDETDNCSMAANSTQQDDDGDDVGNACDVCPNTLPGLTVDPDGCPPLVTGDLDRDGDVDQMDFGLLQACLAGSGSRPSTGCDLADLDEDGDADELDTGVFAICLGGAMSPPQCQ